MTNHSTISRTRFRVSGPVVNVAVVGSVDDVLLPNMYYSYCPVSIYPGDNESLVSAGSSNSNHEDPLHSHPSSKHQKHEFVEEKLPLKDNNNPYGHYGKWTKEMWRKGEKERPLWNYLIKHG